MLTVLDVENCNITNIDELPYLPLLTSLNLGSNKLTNLDNIFDKFPKRS
jgi:Leucine-rich repeat (LRR) protein